MLQQLQSKWVACGPALFAWCCALHDLCVLSMTRHQQQHYFLRIYGRHGGSYSQPLQWRCCNIISLCLCGCSFASSQFALLLCAVLNCTRLIVSVACDISRAGQSNRAVAGAHSLCLLQMCQSAAQLEHASCHSTFQLNRCCDATLQAVVLVTAFTSLPFPAAVTGFDAAAATVYFIDIQCK